MSPVYFVAPGHETPGEPEPGWYFVAENGEPRGPFFSRDEARAGFSVWNAKREAA
jgi:hypothetical protein